METETKKIKVPRKSASSASGSAAPKKEVDLNATVYNARGEKAGTVTLPEQIFGLPWNADLVHQVVISMQSNARTGSAHTKDRGEVRGGGKKPWRQKGTGRARHGSSRSPIWVGGGVTHGPRNEKDYTKKVNRKMREKALLVALSRKYKDGEIIFVDALSMQAPKTQAAKGVLMALTGAGFKYLTTKKKNAALIALPRTDLAVSKSFSNLGSVETIEVRNLNPVSILSSKYLIILEPASAFETLGKKRVIKDKADKAEK